MSEEGEWLNNMRIIMDEMAVEVSETQKYMDVF
jgi:hypothetical protein